MNFFSDKLLVYLIRKTFLPCCAGKMLSRTAWVTLSRSTVVELYSNLILKFVFFMSENKKSP